MVHPHQSLPYGKRIKKLFLFINFVHLWKTVKLLVGCNAWLLPEHWSACSKLPNDKEHHHIYTKSCLHKFNFFGRKICLRAKVNITLWSGLFRRFRVSFRTFFILIRDVIKSKFSTKLFALHCAIYFYFLRCSPIGLRLL